MKIGLIVPCAGSGKRMQSDQNKMLMSLQGKSILARTLEAFCMLDEILEAVLVIREEDRSEIEAIIAKTEFKKPIRAVNGGKERQDSVWKGIEALASEVTHIAIHDGARPFVTQDTLLRNIHALASEDAVCTGVPTKDTLKIVDADRRVIETPDRTLYWNIQTPQCFERGILERAYAHAQATGFQGTDDASLVEHLGIGVRMVLGSYDNIKVTTMEDLAFGEAILRFRKTEAKS